MTLDAKIVNGKLTIIVDVDTEGVESSTKKTRLHVNTGGFTSVDLQIDGKPAKINLMVTTPNR